MKWKRNFIGKKNVSRDCMIMLGFEDRVIQYEEIKKIMEKAPRVIHFDDIPWKQNYMANNKIFSGAHLPDILLKLKRAPILSLSARLQILQPGARSGNHRHFVEALFYILEGKGYEIHDGIRYDWEAGDLIVCAIVLYPPTFRRPRYGCLYLLRNLRHL